MNQHSEISNNGRILSTFQEDDKYRLKYISRDKLTEDSKLIEANLQDRYIAYDKLIEKEMKND